MNKVCIKCGIEYERAQSVRNYKYYCSDKCQRNYWSQQNPERQKEIRKNIWTNNRSKLSCCICGFNRTVDFCHIKWAKDGGRIKQENIAILCPNHHRLFDRNKLTAEEKGKIITYKELYKV